jgi:hypothetical protein
MGVGDGLSLRLDVRRSDSNAFGEHFSLDFSLIQIALRRPSFFLNRG